MIYLFAFLILQISFTKIKKVRLTKSKRTLKWDKYVLSDNIGSKY